MPARTVYRCLCVVNGCNAFLDPRTGQLGRILSSKQYASHEKSERSRMVAESMSRLQAQALQLQESELTAHASDSTPSPTTSTTAQNYRSERQGRIISYISPIADACEAQIHNKESLGPVTDQSSNGDLVERSKYLRSATEQLGSMLTDLEVIPKAHPIPSRWHAAKTFFGVTKDKVDATLTSFENELQFCQNMLLSRERAATRQREAQAGYYNTGKSESCFKYLRVLISCQLIILSHCWWLSNLLSN
jgi:hypothetical protein